MSSTSAGQSKFRVIVADPPWNYDNSRINGAAENHYKTMTVREIMNLPVRELAHESCALFLWATWPQLREALEITEAWGFKYLTGLPWIKINGYPSVNLWGELELKPQYGIGFWVRGCTEPLLIAKRGEVKPPEGDFVGLLSENFGHSRKPENVYHIAERLPGPYLEMFARRKRAGWTSYGDEVAGDSTLTI